MSKTILITGCSTGFGYLFTLTLARAGFQVAATSRKKDRMKELEAVVNTEQLPVKFYELDVTKPETIANAIQTINNDFNSIDVLVNNAGYGLYSFIEHVTMKEMEDQFKTNVFGLVNVTQSVIPIMKSQNCGQIINISSAAAAGVFPSMGFYAASKWAVEALSEAQHMELKANNINVTLIQPGPYNTSFGVNSVHNPADDNSFFETKKKKIQAPFKGDSQEVANLLLKIVRTKKPKLRYPVGHTAKLAFFLRKILPQPFFLWILEKILGI